MRFDTGKLKRVVKKQGQVDKDQPIVRPNDFDGENCIIEVILRFYF